MEEMIIEMGEVFQYLEQNQIADGYLVKIDRGDGHEHFVSDSPAEAVRMAYEEWKNPQK